MQKIARRKAPPATYNLDLNLVGERLNNIPAQAGTNLALFSTYLSTMFQS